jgi:hypothetical protein
VADKLHALLKEIQILEQAVEDQLQRAEAKVSYSAKEGKIFFSKEVLEVHRSIKENLGKYLVESNFLFILTAPIIYSMFVPAFILDCFCCLYQTICFPVYRIPKVTRSRYVRADRHKLAYLNAVEKLNCDFCGYFNGVLAFAREIGSRTEQYWCPIRHALAVKGAHSRYNRFFDYGDAKTYRTKLDQLRKELQSENNDSKF